MRQGYSGRLRSQGKAYTPKQLLSLSRPQVKPTINTNRSQGASPVSELTFEQTEDLNDTERDREQESRRKSNDSLESLPASLQKDVTLKSIPILNGAEDFIVWQTHMRNFLMLKDYWKYVKRNCVECKYQLVNETIKAFFMKTVSKELSLDIALMPTAYSTWQHLESKLIGARDIQLQDVMKQLHNLQFNTLQKMIDKYRRLASTICLLDRHVTQHQLCSVFLYQLPNDQFRF